MGSDDGISLWELTLGSHKVTLMMAPLLFYSQLLAFLPMFVSTAVTSDGLRQGGGNRAFSAILIELRVKPGSNYGNNQTHKRRKEDNIS
jgi:hypothetical protein